MLLLNNFASHPSSSFLDETEYEYSGSEEEGDELNEDEGEPRSDIGLAGQIGTVPGWSPKGPTSPDPVEVHTGLKVAKRRDPSLLFQGDCRVSREAPAPSPSLQSISGWCFISRASSAQVHPLGPALKLG